MPTWSIGYPEKERLEVELLGEPASDRGYDWIQARVRIDVGGFKGDVAMMLTLSDILRFRTALEPVYRDVRGSAEFKTIEGQLQIKVEVDKLGHVKASGFVRDDASFGNRLTFGIEFDQTLLWHTISEIDEAVFELKK